MLLLRLGYLFIIRRLIVRFSFYTWIEKRY